MARGVRRKSFEYEIDHLDNAGNLGVIALMAIEMDAFNTGTAADKVNLSSSPAPYIQAHIKLHKNEKTFGIHPRYVLCEYTGTLNSSSCYGATPKRFVKLPILTLTQFSNLRVYDEVIGGTQANTLMTINHSFDGSTSLTYKIRKLVNQVLI